MAVRSQQDTIESLKPFFHPRTIAVFGASREEASIRYRLL
jgi:acyl-CoA synthetase (NDP forming)